MSKGLSTVCALFPTRQAQFPQPVRVGPGDPRVPGAINPVPTDVGAKADTSVLDSLFNGGFTMAKKLSQLEIAKQEAENIAKETYEKINELGFHASSLYRSMNSLQLLFDRIQNLPIDHKGIYEKHKEVSADWKEQVDNLTDEYKKKELGGPGVSALGIGAGIAVATIGRTAAFLVGGRIVGGAMFALAGGPIGWAIAGISILKMITRKKDTAKLEQIYERIFKRDVEFYSKAITEINERVHRIDDELEKLDRAIGRIATFGTDYSSMTTTQQFDLAAFFNLFETATMLLVTPIMNLQPHFSEQDFYDFYEDEVDPASKEYLSLHKNMTIFLANFLYEIPLDDKDKELLAQSLTREKVFCASIEKNNFSVNDIDVVERALRHKANA